MIKVEHPQSQQVSRDQLNEQNQGTQQYQIASLSLLKAQNMLPSMVTLFLKLTGLAAELLPEGGIKPVSNLMKVESNPESLTTHHHSNYSTSATVAIPNQLQTHTYPFSQKYFQSSTLQQKKMSMAHCQSFFSPKLNSYVDKPLILLQVVNLLFYQNRCHGQFYLLHKDSSSLFHLSTMPTELCTCPRCKKNISTDANGKVYQGLYVDRSTRHRHWARVASEPEETTLAGLFPQLCIAYKPDKTDEESGFKASEEVDSMDVMKKKDLEVIALILSFMMWLYLTCGLSKSSCRKARDSLAHIMQIVSSNTETKPSFETLLPCDMQTVIKKLKLEVTLERYVCCTRCYSLYDVETAPRECSYQETLKSPYCGADLFQLAKFRRLSHIVFPTQKNASFSNRKKYTHIQLPNQPRLKTPHATFLFQPLLTWITWFLNSAGVEEAIDEWTKKLTTGISGHKCDISHGEVWHKLFDQDTSEEPMQLGLSLFIDCFNPQGNKTSGEQMSMGIIALNCLNLPPRLQNQPQYTCLSGIIPSPNQPNMNTMNNVLTPLVNELVELNGGVKICTAKFPKGHAVVIKLVNLIGDIVANHKVAGFKSHAARKFCSWCDIKDHQRVELKLGNLRNSKKVLALAHQWREIESIKGKRMQKRSMEFAGQS
ncbi:hypothetical protein O181_076904 [Austropuccinia psidii MF-1]|uniref:Uncharacterized protein n=1 Tax=Austropuccinia psidii MF-1 TaxID=1389203 RepID=A0A9Q3IFV1_9BASI|nr:hypothetical protein [Austropuccinia psidii MF-1]